MKQNLKVTEIQPQCALLYELRMMLDGTEDVELQLDGYAYPCMSTI